MPRAAAQMLDSNYAADAHLTAAALVCVWAVLLVRGPTPVNHYCRLLAKANLMPQLLAALASIIATARTLHDPSGSARSGPLTGGTLRGAAARPLEAPDSPDKREARMRALSDHLESICDLIVVLSRSDAVVKATVSHPDTFKQLLRLVDDLPADLLVKALTAVRNLTDDPQAVRQIQEAGGVPLLVTMLRRNATASRVELTPDMHLPLLEARSASLPGDT
jgi:hypothetical protein